LLVGAVIMASAALVISSSVRAAFSGSNARSAVNFIVSPHPARLCPVDTMPLLDHGRRALRGQALTLAAAMAAFREAFMSRLDGLEPGEWERNRDYKRPVKRMRP